jgi:hypothetical protein
MVPVTALRHGNNGDFVYVLKADKTVTVRMVTRGQATTDMVEIRAGLEAGEQVITEGADRLKEGAKVMLAGDKPARAGAGGAAAGANGERRRRQQADGAAGASASASASASAASPASAPAASGEGRSAMSPSLRSSSARSPPLLMLAIVLAGLVGFKFLPLSACRRWTSPPSRCRRCIRAPARSDGQTVTAPLERQFGQMAGLQRMSSTSAAGVSIITLQFTWARRWTWPSRKCRPPSTRAARCCPPTCRRRPCTPRSTRPTRRC